MLEQNSDINYQFPPQTRPHIFSCDIIPQIVNSALDQLVKMQRYPLAFPGKVLGTGVYAIYYSGDATIYDKYGVMLDPEKPIYIGKAVPAGARIGKEGDDRKALEGRIKEHAKSIKQAHNLDIGDFTFSYLVMVGREADIIPAVESGAFRILEPVWNTAIPGFGNHDPGSGRYDQAVSMWDRLHPGRPWVEKLTGSSTVPSVVKTEPKVKVDQLALF